MGKALNMGLRMGLGLSGCALAAMLAGCDWPQTSPDNSLPALLTLSGQAMLPDDYMVAADTQPAPRSFRTTLSTMGGQTVAVGTITDDQGHFSLSVPTTSLADANALYEIQLLDRSHSPIYRSLVRLSGLNRNAGVLVNGVSTTVALAAHEALRRGLNPARWQLDTLAANSQIQSLGLQYAHQLSQWSNQTSGQATIASDPPSPLPSLLDTVIRIAGS